LIQISLAVTKNCRVYDILNRYIDVMYLRTLSHQITPLCTSYNDVALKIILDCYPCNDSRNFYIAKIIKSCDDKLWSTENEHFKNVLFTHTKENDNLRTDFLNKMFLYGCKYETLKFLKINDLCLNDKFSVVEGIRNCFDNANGLPIISWIIHDQKFVLNPKDIIILLTSVSYKDSNVINYWKNMHDNVISDYYKNINDKELNDHFHISYNPIINVVYRYIDANRIINGICSQRHVSSPNTMKTLSRDTLNYLSDNIIFSEIDEIHYPKLLYFFWTCDNSSVLEKFLSHPSSKEKKIKVLVKFLSLISDNSDDFEMISYICNTITQIKNLNQF
jgi:hypothetical protein